MSCNPQSGLNQRGVKNFSARFYDENYDGNIVLGDKGKESFTKIYLQNFESSLPSFYSTSL